MHVSGDYIYIFGNYNLRCYALHCSGSFRGILDISDKTNPVAVGDFEYYSGQDINGICASGNYMYVGGKHGDIRIFDITDKANPVEIGSYCPDDYYVSSMQIAGDYIYGIGYYSSSGHYYGYGGGNMFKIIDITDKVNPVEVGSYNVYNSGIGIKAIHLMGDYLYLLTQSCVYASYEYIHMECSSRIRIVDISNKEHPFEVGSYEVGSYELESYQDWSYVMCASGDYIYTGDADAGGLQISQHILRQCANVSVGNSQTITATVPAGFRPGAYNLSITNPDGGHTVLHNAFAIPMDICLSAGLNIFGYPVSISSGYTSYDLIDAIGTETEVDKIQKYDPNSQTYKTTTYDSNGIQCGDLFDIVSGEGYLVYMKMDKSVSFAGAIINPAISCKKGLNIISIPSPPPQYSSYELLSYLGPQEEITSIQRFNRRMGIFETTNYCYGQPSGIKFNIVNGEAYLIHMKTAKDKVPPTVDQ